MNYTYTTIIALAFSILVCHAADKDLPEGISKAYYHEIGITSMTDAAVAYLNQPELVEREGLRLSFGRGITDADLARLKEVPWATKLIFSGVQEPVKVEHLRPCTNLMSVKFARLEVVDLAALKDFPKLEVVTLDAVKGLADLEWATGLTQINELNLYGLEGITDYSPLGGLTNITSLSMNAGADTTTEMLAPLGKLVNLEKLSFYSYPCADISPFATCVNLKDVTLNKAKSLVDLTAAAKWKRVTSLNLRSTAVADIKPLAACEKLAGLDLKDSAVTNLAPLAKLSNLMSLNVSGTAVTDLRPLAKLPSLYSLDLRGSAVTSIAPLKSLTTLKSLYVSDGVSAGQRAALAKALPDLKIKD